MATAPITTTLKQLSRELDTKIAAAEGASPGEPDRAEAWVHAADVFVKLADAKTAADTARGRPAIADLLGYRDGVESRGLIVTQGIAAALGDLGDVHGLAGKHQAALQALYAYATRGSPQ